MNIHINRKKTDMDTASSWSTCIWSSPKGYFYQLYVQEPGEFDVSLKPMSATLVEQ